MPTHVTGISNYIFDSKASSTVWRSRSTPTFNLWINVQSTNLWGRMRLVLRRQSEIPGSWGAASPMDRVVIIKDMAAPTFSCSSLSVRRHHIGVFIKLAYTHNTVQDFLRTATSVWWFLCSVELQLEPWSTPAISYVWFLTFTSGTTIKVLVIIDGLQKWCLTLWFSFLTILGVLLTITFLKTERSTGSPVGQKVWL